jgi:hypothetical protein
LQTEVLALRHQLDVLRQRVAVSNIDGTVFAGLYHLAPEVLNAVKIPKPETTIRWHRAADGGRSGLSRGLPGSRSRTPVPGTLLDVGW